MLSMRGSRGAFISHVSDSMSDFMNDFLLFPATLTLLSRSFTEVNSLERAAKLTRK